MLSAHCTSEPGAFLVGENRMCWVSNMMTAVGSGKASCPLMVFFGGAKLCGAIKS